MRIVQVIPDFGLGGIQKAGCVLGKALAERGCETLVVAPEGGDRFEAEPGFNTRHSVVENGTTEGMRDAILAFRPDVVHIHQAHFEEALIAAIAASGDKPPLVVSTPVFGRPPISRDVFKNTKTAVVGTYILHRLRHWLNLSLDEAMRSGIVFTPVVSFQHADQVRSTLMDSAERAKVRAEFGIPADAEVLGRVGRDTLVKWSTKNVELVNRFLAERPRGVWLSVGMPDELGVSDLRARWGDRYVAIPESSNYSLLTRAYASMDLQAFFSPYGECFAATICEPAGLGLPTIAATNPIRDNGQSEQVVDGVTGYLVASVDGALRRAYALFDDPAELRRLQQSTLDYAQARWTPEVISGVLLELFQAWLSDDPMSHPRMQAIEQEAREFDESYLPRMFALHARGPISRLKWNVKLMTVRSWTLFDLVARVKRRLTS